MTSTPDNSTSSPARKPPQPVLEHWFAAPYAIEYSAAAQHRFPFPFTSGRTAPFRYTVNIEPHQASGIEGAVDEFYFDIDEFYFAELKERQRALAATPGHYQLRDDLQPAAWELLVLSLRRLAKDYPNYFNLLSRGNRLCWLNHLTGSETLFTEGDSATLPQPPLLFLAQQLPGDWALLEQKEAQLWLAGGVVTGPAGWSLAEKFGMNYLQWHAPVPDDYQVFERSLKYLSRLPAGQPVRRKNWGLCAYPRLETSMENFSQWGRERDALSQSALPETLNLRVEFQVLERLPNSQAISFYIRTYFLPFKLLATNPAWTQTLHSVLASLPEAICHYKGLAGVQAKAVTYLKEKIA